MSPTRRRRARTPWLLAAALCGCTPPPISTSGVACPVVPVADGAVWVGPVVCQDQLFLNNGEGAGSDVWLANARFRAVLRSPQSALTLSGLGGGTLIDAAPWSRADALHELAPLVDGGWLAVSDLTVGDDHVDVTGVVRSLPGRPASLAEGQERAVTWRIRADSPWLELEGADGLWVHPSDNMELVDGWLANDRVVLGHDGVVEEDLGGAVRIRDATRLLIGDVATAWGERPGPVQSLSASVVDAASVELFRGATRTGWLPVVDGRIDATVPADVDGVRAVGLGRARGPLVPPGQDLILSPGAPGDLALTLYWPGQTSPHPVLVRWTDGEGTTGKLRVAAGGALLPTGPGTFTVTVDGGPALMPSATIVQVDPDSSAQVTMLLAPAVVSARHVLASLDWLGSRSRSVRSSAAERTSDAVMQGVAWAITTAQDDVESSGAYTDDIDRIRLVDATTLTSPQGWAITSWPWRATPRRSGHGAPPVRHMTATEALAAAWGGDGIGRTTRVDLAWLAAAGPPWTLEHGPDLVSLPPPGAPPFEAWRGWFTWLDAGRFLRPSGPYHWFDIATPALWGEVELARALTFARFSTGTGAWVNLDVDGAGPGQLAPRPALPVDTDPTEATDDPDTASDGPLPRSVRAVVQPGATTIDRVSIVTDGGRVLVTHPVAEARTTWTDDLLPDTWVVAIAWSTIGTDWAVTAPIWLRSPADAPPEVPE